jgi:MFS transporter, OPA family, glycerol-3-phosphate transporter
MNRTNPAARRSRFSVLGSLWLIYAFYYLGRVNHSVGQNGLLEQFHWNKTEVGAIASAFTLFYAIGQFINGNLGDTLKPRRLLVVGLLGSALMNALFGFSNSLGVLVGLWSLNGLFQSTGWPVMLKTLAGWFDTKARGIQTSWWGTGYQVGNVAAWLLAAWCLSRFGWRAAYWAPVPLLLAMAWFAYKFYPEIPVHPVSAREKKASLLHRSRAHAERTVRNPAIWLLAGAYTLLGFVRYCFLNWSITYFVEIQHGSIAHSTLKSILFPTLGIVGVLMTGWMSEKVFQSRRAPMGFWLFVLLGIGILVFPNVPASPWIWSTLALGILGLLLYGADFIIGVPVTQDHSDKRSVAQAAGFIDGMMYLGAIFAGAGSGYVIDRFGWNQAFILWAALAWLGALLLIPLWKGPLRLQQGRS